jgi:hypothetical protein
MLNVIKPCVIMLNVIKLCVIILNVIMLSVVVLTVVSIYAQSCSGTFKLSPQSYTVVSYCVCHSSLPGKITSSLP